MENLIITSKDYNKSRRREMIFFILGIAAGIFLLVYSAVYSKNAMHFLCGVVIIAAEIIIYCKEAANHKSFVAVYEDGVCGKAVSKANAAVNIDFSLKFNEITEIHLQNDELTFITTDGNYLCKVGDRGKEIYEEVKKCRRGID